MNRQEIALSNLENDRIYGRKAIAYRGGEITSDAGFYEIVHKIPTLPMTSTGTWIDDTVSNFKIVPEGSIDYCYLKSLGGMTYKKNNNVMPFPYDGPGGSMDVGSVLQYGGFTISVTSDKSLAISRSYEIIDDTVKFDVNVPSDDYYLTVTHIGDNFFDVSSNVGNIPFNTPVFIPKETGITYINIHGAPESEGSATISLLLTKEPNYREYLSDNKPTAIKVHGANLIPFPYYGDMDVGHTYTKNGVTYTVNADRSITINGTATANTSVIFGNYYNLPDGDYVFSANHISGEWVSGAYIRNTDQDMLYNHPVAKFTSPTRKLTWWGIYVNQGTTVNNLTFKPMLNRGTTAIPYTDYHAPITYPIPEALQGTGKGVEGASDTVDFENGEKIIKTHTVVFDGTENWKYVPNWGTVTMKSPSFLPKKGVANNQILTNAPMSCVFSDSNYDRLRFGDIDYSIDPIENYGINSVEDWIDYLKERYAEGDPITVTYAIAEPTETDIDILDPTVSGFINLLKVQGGGAIEIITDNGGNIPTTIIFQIIS